MWNELQNVVLLQKKNDQSNTPIISKNPNVLKLPCLILVFFTPYHPNSTACIECLLFNARTVVRCICYNNLITIKNWCLFFSEAEIQREKEFISSLKIQSWYRGNRTRSYMKYIYNYLKCYMLNFLSRYFLNYFAVIFSNTCTVDIQFH